MVYEKTTLSRGFKWWTWGDKNAAGPSRLTSEANRASLCRDWGASPNKKPRFRVVLNGGRDRDRTDDLLVANEALSQLSYTPENRQLRYFQHIYYSIYGNKNKNIFIFSRRARGENLPHLKILFFTTILYL